MNHAASLQALNNGGLRVFFRFRTLRAIVIGLAAVSGICLATAGCGSTSSADPLAGMSAKQVLDKAVSDLKSAPSADLSGTLNGPGGNVGLRLGFKHGKGCEGTVSEGSKGSFALVVIGDTAWLKPDDTFWKAYAGSNAPQAIALLGGRYLKGSTSNSNVSSFTYVCDLNSLASSFGAASGFVKEAVTTFDGQRAVPLKEEAKGDMMYVTDTSAPRILEVNGTQPGYSGKVTFAYSPVTLTAPPASDTVDGTSLGF